MNMAYDWKTSKLVQAKMVLGIAKEATSDARMLLDHDRDTFELAKKALKAWDDITDLYDEVSKALEDYKDEKTENKEE